jgi:hypothetical protein
VDVGKLPNHVKYVSQLSLDFFLFLISYYSSLLCMVTTREIEFEIGDAILEEIKNEIVTEMFNFWHQLDVELILEYLIT